MADRFKYAEVRQKIIDAIRTDLIGPLSPEEVLDENPRFAYLVGMLEPQRDENAPDENEQEIDTDIDYGKDEDFTAGEDDDNEPVSTTKFQLPSSLGISFYVESSLDRICLDVSWGDYVSSIEKVIGKDEKEHNRTVYRRVPESETVRVKFSDFRRTKDYQLAQDANIHVHVSRIPLKDGYSLVTAYVVNKRSNPSSDIEGLMFQVGIKAHAEDGSAVFMRNTSADMFLRLTSSISSSDRSWDVAEVVPPYGVRPGTAVQTMWNPHLSRNTSIQASVPLSKDSHPHTFQHGRWRQRAGNQKPY